MFPSLRRGRPAGLNIYRGVRFLSPPLTFTAVARHPTGEPQQMAWTGRMKMNPYKVRAIVEHVRRQGGLPTDQFGNVLPPDDLLVWFGLNKVLTIDEQRHMKNEFEAMQEGQSIGDWLQRR